MSRSLVCNQIKAQWDLKHLRESEREGERAIEICGGPCRDIIYELRAKLKDNWTETKRGSPHFKSIEERPDEVSGTEAGP